MADEPKQQIEPSNRDLINLQNAIGFMDNGRVEQGVGSNGEKFAVQKPFDYASFKPTYEMMLALDKIDAPLKAYEKARKSVLRKLTKDSTTEEKLKIDDEIEQLLDATVKLDPFTTFDVNQLKVFENKLPAQIVRNLKPLWTGTLG